MDSTDLKWKAGQVSETGLGREGGERGKKTRLDILQEKKKNFIFLVLKA